MRAKKRQAIAFFVHTDDDAPIEPLTGKSEKYQETTSFTHSVGKIKRLTGHTYK